MVLLNFLVDQILKLIIQIVLFNIIMYINYTRNIFISQNSLFHKQVRRIHIIVRLLGVAKWIVKLAESRAFSASTSWPGMLTPVAVQLLRASNCYKGDWADTATDE